MDGLVVFFVFRRTYPPLSNPYLGAGRILNLGLFERDGLYVNIKDRDGERS